MKPAKLGTRNNAEISKTKMACANKQKIVELAGCSKLCCIFYLFLVPSNLLMVLLAKSCNMVIQALACPAWLSQKPNDLDTIYFMTSYSMI